MNDARLQPAAISSIAGTTPKGGGLAVLQLQPALASADDRIALDMAQAVRAAGGVAILASAGGALLPELKRVGSVHHQLPLDGRNPFTIRSNAAKLVRLVQEEEVGLIHARGVSAVWPAYLAARRTGIGLVVGVDSLAPRSHALANFYNGVVARADRIVAVSDYLADRLRRRYGLDDRRLRVVGRGIDLMRFDPARVTPERVIQLAQQWRLPDGLPVVMMPVRFARGSGVATLLAALAAIGSREFHVLLVSIGDGEEGFEGELEAEIARHGLGGRVQIEKECRDMPAAYRLADVVVHAASEPAAFLPAIAEAQAMGRPVVALAHGAAVEQFARSPMGWLAEPGDPAALGAAIGKALSLTLEDRERLSGEAVMRAHARYDKGRMCAATLAVYRELLEVQRWRTTPALTVA
jgi:glycosyltransferase involved in cell wall biosynthesis